MITNESTDNLNFNDAKKTLVDLQLAIQKVAAQPKKEFSIPLSRQASLTSPSQGDSKRIAELEAVINILKEVNAQHATKNEELATDNEKLRKYAEAQKKKIASQKKKIAELELSTQEKTVNGSVANDVSNILLETIQSTTNFYPLSDPHTTPTSIAIASQTDDIPTPPSFESEYISAQELVSVLEKKTQQLQLALNERDDLITGTLSELQRSIPSLIKLADEAHYAVPIATDYLLSLGYTEQQIECYFSGNEKALHEEFPMKANLSPEEQEKYAREQAEKILGFKISSPNKTTPVKRDPFDFEDLSDDEGIGSDIGSGSDSDNSRPSTPSSKIGSTTNAKKGVTHENKTTSQYR